MWIEYPKEKIVDDGPQDDAVNPGTDVSCKCGTFFEDAHWHHGFFDNVIFDEPEEDHAKDTDDERCDDIGGDPGVDDSSGGESEEERCSAADKDDNAEVVDTLEFLSDGSRVRLEGKEEPDSGGNDNDDRDIDVKNPIIRT